MLQLSVLCLWSPQMQRGRRPDWWYNPPLSTVARGKHVPNVPQVIAGALGHVVHLIAICLDVGIAL